MTSNFFGIHPDDDPRLFGDSTSSDQLGDEEKEVIDPDIEVSTDFYDQLGLIRPNYLWP